MENSSLFHHAYSPFLFGLYQAIIADTTMV